MSKNVNHLQHVKSNVVENGKPKLPTTSILAEGEIGVNYADGYETLSIKSNSGNIVTFSSDEYFTKLKLGSGFTGANSANTVTSVIKDNEEVISTAINDLEQRKSNTGHTHDDRYYTEEELTGSSTTVVVAKAASATTAASANSVALSNVSGADDLKAIEALTGTKGILKKTAANTWSLDTTSYSSATQVNTALEGKSDTGHTHDDRYYTKNEIDDVEYVISQSLNDLNADKLNASDFETYSGTVNTTVTAHTADTTIHFTTGTVQTQIDNSISGKVNTSDIDQVLDDTVSASTNPISSKAVYGVICDNELAVSQSLNNLNERVNEINDTIGDIETLLASI